MLTRNAEIVKPWSSAPPVAEMRPPPSVPSSASICAWFAVNLIAVRRFAMDHRSLPNKMDTEPLSIDAVPRSRGCSKLPLMRIATSAVPDEKKSGDTPFSTRRLRSPLTFTRAARERAVKHEIAAWSGKPRRLESNFAWREANDEGRRSRKLNVLDAETQLGKTRGA